MIALVAPDSFKGTLGAAQVAAAVAAGLESSGIDTVQCPVADGGEGTLEVLLNAHGGETLEVAAADPLGRTIQATFALLDGPPPVTAVVETARAIGLDKVSESERDPWTATSCGAGDLIVAAARAGADRILVATGGSATVDGGVGALKAVAATSDLGGVDLVVLCDVATPWENCAEVFGPQKGADAATVRRLTARLDEVALSLPRDPRGVPGTGAAGGLSGALWASLDAQLKSGAAVVLEACGFEERLRAVDAVVVGEGRIDEQSLDGKIVGVIARRAAECRRPVHAIVGENRLTPEAAAEVGIATVTEAGSTVTLERAGARLGAALRVETSTS